MVPTVCDNVWGSVFRVQCAFPNMESVAILNEKSNKIYTHLYLQALIQVPSVRIWWIPVPFFWNLAESSGMDAFLQESVGHQKVQGGSHP